MSRNRIVPNPENSSLEELDRLYWSVPSRRQSHRIWAIRCLIMGQPYETITEMMRIDGQTLRRWIKRFNAEGVDGLLDKARSGRPRKIPSELGSGLKLVIKDPSLANQTHWTARKFHGYLRDELGLEVGYRATVNWLHDHGFRLKVPRSWPLKQDEEARGKWLSELRLLMSDPEVEIWYLDECGVDGDPRPRQRWTERGSKPTRPYGGRHLRMSVAGLICPRTGEFYALEFTRSNSLALQAFLNHATADIVLQRSRNVIICDNASWHRNKSIAWGVFEPMFLPPYSPDLNPIERLWLLIKNEWFSDFIANNMDQLIERLDHALIWAMDRNEGNQKTCAI